MGELNLKDINRTLVKGLQMIVAFRMLVKPLNLDYPEFADLEREYREAAADVQREMRL